MHASILPQKPYKVITILLNRMINEAHQAGTSDMKGETDNYER